QVLHGSERVCFGVPRSGGKQTTTTRCDRRSKCGTQKHGRAASANTAEIKFAWDDQIVARLTARPLTKDEARRFATNVAKVTGYRRSRRPERPDEYTEA